jgi:hypothetical protein
MKAKFFTSTFALAGLILLLSACSSSKSSTKKYPFPGSPIPQEKSPGQQPTDKNGGNENSNAAHPTNLPPGQAKKIYGEKSAKVFAPGQRKKQGNHYYPLIVLKTPDIISCITLMDDIIIRTRTISSIGKAMMNAFTWMNNILTRWSMIKMS